MLTKKSLFSYVILVVSFAAIFSYSLVFAVPAVNNEEMVYFDSKKVFLSDNKAPKNTLIIKTNSQSSDFNISGNCGINAKFLSSKNSMHIFVLSVTDKNCKEDSITVDVKKGDNTIKRAHLKTIKDYDIYNIMLDISSKHLGETSQDIIKRIENKQLANKNQKLSFINHIKNNRLISELDYVQGKIQDILAKRKNKYKIPVLGAAMPTKTHKIPNTARPYRKDYTDGIHHGWDFDAEKGDSVISIDDGIVIRVEKGFLFSDLGKIKKSKNLTYEDKLKNLDILRGNQVWIKTMKGDVAFYSHLDIVFDDIQVGTVVRRGQPIGTIGLSGVPDKNYNDFHLHIPIHKNPYIDTKAGKYSYLDYMKWDWYFKGKSLNYVLKNQKSIFEK